MNDPTEKWQETERGLIFSHEDRPHVKAWFVKETKMEKAERWRSYYEIGSITGGSPRERTEYVIHAADLILSNFYLYGRDWSRYLDRLKKLVLMLNEWQYGDPPITQRTLFK